MIDIKKLKDYEHPDIAERFLRDTKNHQLKVMHDDGLYRHLRMMNPKDGAYWYDIITWPHNLLFRGDGESYSFSRVEDMFQFFRSGWYGGSIHINTSYWAEKLTSNRDCVEGYQEELFREALAEQAQALTEGMGPDEAKRFLDAVRDQIEESGDYSTMDAAIQTVEGFEFYSNPDHEFDYRHQADVTFEDSWEWIRHCKDYDWWFLWSLYGIVRAIVEYDRLKGVGGPVDVSQMGLVVA